MLCTIGEKKGKVNHLDVDTESEGEDPDYGNGTEGPDIIDYQSGEEFPNDTDSEAEINHIKVEQRLR